MATRSAIDGLAPLTLRYCRVDKTVTSTIRGRPGARLQHAPGSRGQKAAKMDTIEFSPDAINKILYDIGIHRELGVHNTPRLVYASNVFSERDGVVIDHGPSLFLSFGTPESDPAPGTDCGREAIEVSGHRILVTPASFFGSARHKIDLVERRLTLESSEIV